MSRGNISVWKTKNVTWKSLVLSSLFVVYGCIPEPLDVDGIPVVKPEIVVSTQIIPDQSIVVLLTKTFGALDASDDSDPQALLDQIAINDATVTITGPSGTYLLESLDNGFYGGLVIPFETGESYQLKVNSESLGEVSAVTTVKPMISFQDLEAELYYTGFDDTLAQVAYRFKDPIETNWYMLNVQHIEGDELLEDVINPNSFIRLVDDQNFDGQQYGETFRVFPREFSPGDTISVSLSNISEEYYDFMQLRLDNRFSFIEYLSEPINYPSNIKGGKGFFNLYVPDIRLLILE
jgi:hypothetical protein